MIKDDKSSFLVAHKSLSLEDIIMMQQDEPSQKNYIYLVERDKSE